MTNEELAVRIQQGAAEYMPQLWEQVRLLIAMMANRFYTQNQERCESAGVMVDDLLQEGFFALVYAVQAYKPEGEYKFTTYLNHPLRTRFKAATGGRDNNKVETLNRCKSLDMPIGEDTEATFADVVPDTEAAAAYEAAEHMADNERLRTVLDDCMAALPDDWQEVLRRRYFGNEFLTTVSKAVGKSYNQVKNIEGKGLLRLRTPQNRRKLLPFLQEEVIEREAYKGSGYGTFKSTMSSSVERALERMDRYRAELSQK